MEQLNQRSEALHNILDRLDESLNLLHDRSTEQFYTQMRDSVIQRFEIAKNIGTYSLTMRSIWQTLA